MFDMKYSGTSINIESRSSLCTVNLKVIASEAHFLLVFNWINEWMYFRGYNKTPWEQIWKISYCCQGSILNNYRVRLSPIYNTSYCVWWRHIGRGEAEERRKNLTGTISYFVGLSEHLTRYINKRSYRNSFYNLPLGSARNRSNPQVPNTRPRNGRQSTGSCWLLLLESMCMPSWKKIVIVYEENFQFLGGELIHTKNRNSGDEPPSPPLL